MKIVIAMDSFKGSCCAFAAGEAVKRGALKACPDAFAINLPAADGGEGTVEALIGEGRGRWYPCAVTGPLGDRTDAGFGAIGDTAVIEMSAASGILLVEKERLNPLTATTFGTGELIRAALDAGFRDLLIAIGGSATNDGGAGMAQALGVRLEDETGAQLPPGGAALERLVRVDISGLDPRLKACRITVASDVTNPLCGPEGASWMFGRQKGATEQMQARLDAALAHYAAVLRDQLGADVMNLPGAGAAGGLGAALYAFLNAKFRPGVEAVLETIGFAQNVRGADIVFTGEGRTDGQTCHGKTPAGVAAASGGVPVYVLCGGIGSGAEKLYEMGVDGIFSIADGPISLEQSQARAEELLERCAEAVTRAFCAARRA